MKEKQPQGTQQFPWENPKGKNPPKLPQYRLPVCNDQRTKYHQVRD